MDEIADLMARFCAANFSSAFDRWVDAVMVGNRTAAHAALQDEVHWLRRQRFWLKAVHGS